MTGSISFIPTKTSQNFSKPDEYEEKKYNTKNLLDEFSYGKKSSDRTYDVNNSLYLVPKTAESPRQLYSDNRRPEHKLVKSTRDNNKNMLISHQLGQY